MIGYRVRKVYFEGDETSNHSYDFAFRIGKPHRGFVGRTSRSRVPSGYVSSGGDGSQFVQEEGFGFSAEIVTT